MWNKGSSHFKPDNDKFLPIQTEIEYQTGHIILLSEAEFTPKDKTDIFGQFPNYEIHYKGIPGAKKECVMIMVQKNTVNITRLENFEQPATSCVWFKIKTQDTNFVLPVWYR